MKTEDVIAMLDEDVDQRLHALSEDSQLYAVEKGGMFYRHNCCGYTDSLEAAGRFTKEQAQRELVQGEPMSIVAIPPKKWTSDLNVCQSGFDRLDGYQKYVYRTKLFRIVGGEDWEKNYGEKSLIWLCVTASAPQRARALLIALTFNT